MAVELLRDRWNLVELRDHLRAASELPGASVEGSAANVLADMLERLSDVGLLSRRSATSGRQKIDYRLTGPAAQTYCGR